MVVLPLARHNSVNPLTPTVVIWVQLWSILCQTGSSHHLNFDIRALWRSALSVRVPGCQNYKWWLNPVWHMMPYSCIIMATVGVKGLKTLRSVPMENGRPRPLIVKLSNYNLALHHHHHIYSPIIHHHNNITKKTYNRRAAREALQLTDWPPE